MLVTRCTTEDLPAADRFGWWHDMTASAMIPTVITSGRAEGFRAAATVVDLGPVQITSLAYPSLVTRRTPRLIRRRDPGFYDSSSALRRPCGDSRRARRSGPHRRPVPRHARRRA